MKMFRFIVDCKFWKVHFPRVCCKICRENDVCMRGLKMCIQISLEFET
jgi:hypothetical protein